MTTEHCLMARGKAQGGCAFTRGDNWLRLQGEGDMWRGLGPG